jgi:hypothetical protein
VSCPRPEPCYIWSSRAVCGEKKRAQSEFSHGCFFAKSPEGLYLLVCECGKRFLPLLRIIPVFCLQKLRNSPYVHLPERIWCTHQREEEAKLDTDYWQKNGETTKCSEELAISSDATNRAHGLYVYSTFPSPHCQSKQEPTNTCGIH